MAKSTIIWTETALKQRRCIFKYWNKRNGSTHYSIQLLFSIQRRMELLEENPNMGKLKEPVVHFEIEMKDLEFF